MPLAALSVPVESAPEGIYHTGGRQLGFTNSLCGYIHTSRQKQQDRGSVWPQVLGAASDWGA